jgi:hypothetical protein
MYFGFHSVFHFLYSVVYQYIHTYLHNTMHFSTATPSSRHASVTVGVNNVYFKTMPMFKDKNYLNMNVI